MVAVLAVTVLQQLLLDSLCSGAVGRYVLQQGVALVERCAVGVGMGFWVVEMAMNVPDQPFTPLGKTLCVFSVFGEASHLHHI